MASNGTSESNGIDGTSGLKSSTIPARTKQATHPAVNALPSTFSSLSISSKAIHADDPLNIHSDVAPPIHVSTTFRYTSDPSKLRPFRAADRPELSFPFQESSEHCYSRVTTHSTSRLEAILESVIGAPTIVYASGLSTVHALLCHLKPKQVSIGDGYHGSHGVIRIHQRLTGLRQLGLDCPTDTLEQGDLIMLETPVNPYGEAFEIQKYADKAHARGAYLMVDSTFAPPPLQDPFKWGADIVWHSGTKYIGGHSDLLCGVLSVRHGLAEDWMPRLLEDREYLGSVMGGLEGWLGVRSMRTMELRVMQQSRNAGHLVAALQSVLDGNKVDEISSRDADCVRAVLKKIYHASLQVKENPWLLKQMPNGFGPVFSIEVDSEMSAKSLPSKLSLFHHATSLGGVESLIEWRTMSDATVSRMLLRVSVGIEAWQDLLADLVQAFKALHEAKS